MQQSDGVEVASYRPVFDFERRIYRIDRLTLNPSGVPVRGIVYAIVIELALAIAAAAPVLGAAVALIPWPARYALAPALLAGLFAMVRLAGRPFHHAVGALCRFALSPRYLHGLRRCEPLGRRWAPRELVMIPDGSCARVRAFRYRGPGAVLVRRAHRRTSYRRGMLGGLLERPDVLVEELPASSLLSEARVLDLKAGAVLDARGARG